MAKTFRPWDVNQAWLLPASVHDFVPPEHLAHLVREIVRDELDLTPILSVYDEERRLTIRRASKAANIPQWHWGTASRSSGSALGCGAGHWGGLADCERPNDHTCSSPDSLAPRRRGANRENCKPKFSAHISSTSTEARKGPLSADVVIPNKGYGIRDKLRQNTWKKRR